MAAPTTVDEFLDLLRKSALIEPAKLDAFLTIHPDGFASPQALAQSLLSEGELTPFHTQQLLRGKHKGFFLGRYKIIDRIGLGGMGQVFLAEHATMKRRAALKVLPPDRAENEYSRERFLREARAQANLDHPNIVRAFDFDTDAEVIFLVMEYVDGVSFHDLVTRAGPLDPGRVAHYLWQSASGLAYLHHHGLIHRDIKPANLLVDRQGVVKILDLGLVRSQAENDNLTRGEGVKILGTADFLAPEQAIDCSKVDGRADIYSLGATAYYLLTGRPPFLGEQIAQKLIAHQLAPVTPISQLRPSVPPALEALVLRMLGKKPSDRPQTPDELMAELEPMLGSPPRLPTELEIPTTVGGALSAGASVQLSSGARRGLGAGPAPESGQYSLSGSGSALRYHSDSKLKPPQPAPPTPPPSKRAPQAAPVADPFAPPALPASATHGAKAPAPAGPLLPAPRPRPAAPANPAPTTVAAPAPAALPLRAIAATAVLSLALAGATYAVFARPAAQAKAGGAESVAGR